MTPQERRLRWWLVLSGLVYLAVGALFLAAPDDLVRVLSSIGDAVSLPFQAAPSTARGGERFWLPLAVSMMACIGTCSLLAARDVRARRPLVLPVIVAKLVSSAAGVFLFVAHGGSSSLVVTGSDVPLFVVTVWFYWSAGRPAPKAEEHPIGIG